MSGVRQRTLEQVDNESAGAYIDPDGRFDDGGHPMDFVNTSAFIANLIACDVSSNPIRYVVPLSGH